MNAVRLMLALRRAMGMLLSGSRKPRTAACAGSVLCALVLCGLSVAAGARLSGIPPATPAWRNPISNDGAHGDQSADDSAAIIEALEYAAVHASTAPPVMQTNVVYLQPGLYRLDHSIVLPPFTATTTASSGTVTVSGQLVGLIAGQKVRIPGAGASGADLVATITAVNSGSITVTPTATTAVTNVSMTIVLDNITVQGDGDATVLYINGNQDGIQVNGIVSHFTIQNMLIVPYNNTQMTSGYAVNVTGTSAVHSDNVTIRNVHIENTYGGINWQYSDSGITSDVTIQNTQGTATNPYMAGNPFVMQACKTHVVHNLQAVALVGNFAKPGMTFDSDCDTIAADNCKVTGAGSNQPGVLIENTLGTGHTGPRLTHLSDTYVENSGAGVGAASSNGYGDGYYITAGRDVRLERCHAAGNAGNGFDIGGASSISGVQGVSMVNCDANQNGRYGYLFTTAAPANIGMSMCSAANNSYVVSTSTGTVNSGATSITLNSVVGFASGDSITIVGAGTGGADLTEPVTGVNNMTNVITFNTATSTPLSIATVYDTTPKFDGVRVESGCQNVRIADCRCGNFIYSYGLQRYGLFIVGGTGGNLTDYIIATSNDFTGNATGGLNNLSSGTNNKIANNVP